MELKEEFTVDFKILSTKKISGVSPLLFWKRIPEQRHALGTMNELNGIRVVSVSPDL